MCHAKQTLWTAAERFALENNLLASADARIAVDDVLTSSPSACCHCPPFSQALMAELLLMTFGSKTHCVASPHSSPNACCRCPPLTQALMAELELMTFGSKSLCRLPCKLQLPTLLTSADARTVADDSGSGPWRRGQQAQGGLCFVFQYTSGWSPASAGIQTQLEPFFLFCSVCPGGHLPLQATGRSPQGMAANVSAGRARTKTWHQSESALLSNCRKRVKLHWERAIKATHQIHHSKTFPCFHAVGGRQCPGLPPVRAH